MEDGRPVLHELVVLDTSERGGECVILTVVNDEGSSFCEFNKLSNVFSEVGSPGANLNRVTHLQVLLGLI